MPEELRFDGQVAVVTGAGGGLGRAYTLLLASRGARVVVNDLGVSKRGEGSSKQAADVVVEEIKGAGGIAVADYNSVEDGEKIVNTALHNFGRIDILINNAGILRDRSFANISDADWDLVHRVHLRGSFSVTRAAWPHMKRQNYGRIIMTSSAAGIYGNFGQGNYSSAKLGLLGLSNTLALEGKRNNIHCNTIAPLGGTRLTEGILPPDLFEELKPELVAPIVLWLCHKDCGDTGGLFEAAGGYFAKYRWERARGHVCRGSLKELVTPEAVRDNWEQICDFSNSSHVTSNEENAILLADVLGKLPEKDNKNSVSVSVAQPLIASGPMSAVGARVSGSSFTYEERDVILYAMGVGLSTMSSEYLRFLYEGNDNFCVLPTFAVIPPQHAVFRLLAELPGWDINPAKILHGEQYVELIKPLPTSSTLKSDVHVVEVLDKGSGAVVIVDAVTFDETNEPVSKTQWTVFVMGAGNFGGPRKGTNAVPLLDPPSRLPDASFAFHTYSNQAALYRLSGDLNPMHIDPEFAALGGFEKPILHGLCTYGIAAHAVLSVFCKSDVSRFRAFKARFARPVVPGQLIVFKTWSEGSRIYINGSVGNTGENCLSGGYIDLVSTSDIPQTVSASSPLQSAAVFKEMTQNLSDHPDLARKVDAVFLWNITVDKKPATQWTVDLKTFPGQIYEGAPKGGMKADVTLTLEDSDLVDLAAGRLNPQKAFMSGKLKVAGNIMLTQKLQAILAMQGGKL